MKTLAFLTLLVFLLGCTENNTTCYYRYVGVFKLNMRDFGKSQQAFIRKRGWDTVSLISEAQGTKGRYYFNSNDPILKEAEGTWYVTGDGIEGGCMGMIKQNNLPAEVSGDAFSLSLRIADGGYSDFHFSQLRKDGSFMLPSGDYKICFDQIRGEYRLDSEVIQMSPLGKIANNGDWASVRLIVDSFSYRFTSNDSLWKKAEGKWDYVTEWGKPCVFYIKQANFSDSLIRKAGNPIIIRIKNDNHVYELPFKRRW